MDVEMRAAERAVARGDMGAAVRLAKIYIGQGRAAEAIPLLERAAKDYPKEVADLRKTEAVKKILKDAARAARDAKKAAQEAARRTFGEASAQNRHALYRGADKVARFFARGAAAVGRAVAGIVSRGVAFLGPVGFAVAVAALVATLAALAYFAWKKSRSVEWSCDCPHVEAGLLTKEFQRDCREREAELKAMTASCRGDIACVREKLSLTVDAEGALSDGQFCRTPGPGAWPIAGSPKDPPAPPAQEEECKSVSGMTRSCR